MSPGSYFLIWKPELCPFSLILINNLIIDIIIASAIISHLDIETVS